MEMFAPAVSTKVPSAEIADWGFGMIFPMTGGSPAGTGLGKGLLVRSAGWAEFGTVIGITIGGRRVGMVAVRE
jgi:hypothetical protein